jgi:transposase
LPQNAREKIASFLACLEKNHNNRTLTAKELGVSVRTIRYWLSRIDEAPPPPNATERAANRIDRRPWTTEDTQTALDLSRQGWTPEEIAVQLKRTRSAVASKLWQVWQDLFRRGKFK